VIKFKGWKWRRTSARTFWRCRV